MPVVSASIPSQGCSIVSEDTPPSLFSRFKRPLVFGALGLVTIALGAGVGVWLNAEGPPKSEGDHANDDKSPGGKSPKKADKKEKEYESLLTNDEVNSAADPAAWDKTATKTDRIANHVKIADESLRIGDYAKAISVYRYLLPHTEGAHKAAILFRLALASECSGASKDALRQYQAIAQRFSQSNWNDVAQLGRVRCLAQTASAGMLDTVVYRNLILDNTALTAPIRREVLHAAARGLCGLLLNERRNEILNPHTLLLAEWNVQPNVELAQLPNLLKAAPREPGDAAFEMLQKIDDNPENIYFKIQARRVELKALLTQLTEQAGLTLKMSAGALDAVISRKQAIHADDVSMSLLLDGLCAPFGLAWYADGSTVDIATSAERSAEENAEFFMARVVRLLDLARIEAADSPQAGYTKIAHGCLLFEKGRAADAAHIFNGEIQSGTTPAVDIEAAFNLGKCYQILNQTADAEQAWYRCVDAGGKDRITRTAAYICLSRIQLEDGRFQKAASSLVMGLALSNGTVLEQQAAALLGSAWLMAGNAPAANSVMFDYKHRLEDEQIRNSVAFAGALARYRVSGLPERREAQGRDVVAALSHFDPGQAFGSHWHVLAAQACEDLGLSDLAMRHYVNAVKELDGGGLRKLTMLKLAERYRDDQRLQEAGEILLAMDTGEPGAVNDEVDLQAADIAMREKDTQTTIDKCHQIVVRTEDEAVRRRALCLMGRAFEKEKNYESAVYCFAGMLPKTLTARAITPAGYRGLK